MKASALALALLALAAAASDQLRGAAQQHFVRTQSYQDVYYLPPPAQLVIASLGHRAALADLIWLKALVYFGEELQHRGNLANLFRYTEAMLTLDPAFKRVYRWVASAAIYRTGKVSAEDVWKAIHYLERGARLFPDDAELAWDLGATYAYELLPLLAAGPQRDEARRKSLEYLEVAALHGAGPAWLGLRTAGQLASLGRKEQAARHLEDLIASATDANLKAELEERLTRLRSVAYVEAMRAASAEFEAGRQRDFPYADTTLYMLLGARPPFDGDALRLRGFDPLVAQGQSGRQSLDAAEPDTKGATPE